MTSSDLDDAYFDWLCGLTAQLDEPEAPHPFRKLGVALYSTSFRWFVRNDGNRAEDGKELREEFLSALRIRRADEEWLERECNLFEMFVALSRRAADASYGAADEWFWVFIENLELARYTDDVYNREIGEEVKDTLQRLTNREYESNGVGGLFPLREAHQDQRRVEIWYQMHAYLLEGLDVDNGP